MSLYRRNGTWWVTIQFNGKRVRRSTGTSDKVEAQEFHDRLRSDLWRRQGLGDKPRKSWPDAVVRWCKVKSHKRTINEDKAKFKALNPYFGHLYLDEMNSEVVHDAVQNFGHSGATRNRYISLIKAVLNAAVEDWEWLDKRPRLPTYEEADERIRWITRGQADELISHLPEHLSDMAEFALQTGIRATPLIKLTWDQVNLERKVCLIPRSGSKSKKPIVVPLSETAKAILIKKQGEHRSYVFTYRQPLKGGVLDEAKPMSAPGPHAFKKACARIGLKDFRWHDLRHTWATWHVMNGTSLRELMELGGWSSYEMVLRYAHLADSYLSLAASRVPAPGSGK